MSWAKSLHPQFLTCVQVCSFPLDKIIGSFLRSIIVSYIGHPYSKRILDRTSLLVKHLQPQRGYHCDFTTYIALLSINFHWIVPIEMFTHPKPKCPEFVPFLHFLNISRFESRIQDQWGAYPLPKPTHFHIMSFFFFLLILLFLFHISFWPISSELIMGLDKPQWRWSRCKIFLLTPTFPQRLQWLGAIKYE